MEPWDRDAYEAVVDDELDDEPRALPDEACGACGRAITGTRVRQGERVIHYACWIRARWTVWIEGKSNRGQEGYTT